MTTAWMLAATLALAPPADTPAPRLDRLVEHVDVRPDGNGRVVTTIDLPAGSGTVIRLPVPLGQAGLPAVRGIAGAHVAAESDGGRVVMVVTLPAAQLAPASFEVSYDVARVVDVDRPLLAYGRRDIRYEFLNLTGAQIGELEATVVLPANLVVDHLSETVAPSATPGLTPVTLTARDGRPAVTCRGRNLGAGGRLGTTIAVATPGSRLPLLIVLTLASLAYLYGWRDLTRAPAAKTTVA